MSDYFFSELAEHLKKRSNIKALGYGTPLKTNNGRHPLVDAYQELLDAILYMRQYIEDRTNDINVDLKVSHDYWVVDEPSPVDNGGDVVIDLVLADLKNQEFFADDAFLHPVDEMYVLTVELAELARVEIENGRIKV